LSVSEDIICTGLGSSITVSRGYVAIGGRLAVEVTAAELEKIAKEQGSSRTISLIAPNSSCASLAGVNVNVVKTSKSGRKITLTTPENNDGTITTLTGLFKVGERVGRSDRNFSANHFLKPAK
jgi:hypothetical protein